MGSETGFPRRSFLRGTAAGIGAAVQSAAAQSAPLQAGAESTAAPQPDIAYPRVYRGRQLAMIAFPLGGVGAGSLSLGGRGQLRDWEIFNRAHKGNAPDYAFPSIWVQAGSAKPVARVLEARYLPPYEGASGLGSNNAPGLARLAGAKFTGEYPTARIDFQDRKLPVRVALEAFSPFIPHDADESGLPVAVLRYRVTNPGTVPAKVSIAFSIENPVKVAERHGGAAELHTDSRANEFHSDSGLAGLVMSNPGVTADDPMLGDFTLGVLEQDGAALTHWRGWPSGRWWNSPMLFWDDFSDDGKLSAEPEPHSAVGSLCVQRDIAAGQSGGLHFLLAWRFPNRTPEWCGWAAPKGDEKTVIGNHYCTRFNSSWDAARHVAANLSSLESRTRAFVTAVRESTIPAPVKEAAMSNLSTLAATTCFRTADGEFHGFEGVNDQRGCCMGNCTHVWNYETATAHLFPSFAHSLRRAAFGYSMDDAGAMHFRQLLPDGKARSGYAAADGQMGQIVHTYLDWKLSGDTRWLKEMWPRVKKALEFAWVKGGWDGDRDGVLEGVQHNTYDVEFYGPNPMCGVYYLAALRACEEMARAVDDADSAKEYRRLFEQGSAWIDKNLFNGEYYVQRVRGFTKDQIAPALRSDMGSENTEQPEYQVGAGCLVDQLVGQYLADVAGLGAMVAPANIRKTLESIYRYNYKRSLAEHDSVQRTYALNDEAAVVVCDYGKVSRPHIPFPYYAEAWTGLEYLAAALMLYAGMVEHGVECIRNTRARYDGERRNPWDEAECGHHYARAMSSWSGMLALSGFRYDGPRQVVTAVPPVVGQKFRSFWASGTGWGTFTLTPGKNGTVLEVQVLAGSLPVSVCELEGGAGKTSVLVQGGTRAHSVKRDGKRVAVLINEPVVLAPGSTMRVEVKAV